MSQSFTRSGAPYGSDPYQAFGQPGQTFTQPAQVELPPGAFQHATPSNVGGLCGPAGAALMAVKSMLQNVPPTTPFEKNIHNCVELLIGHFIEMKHELEIFKCKSIDFDHSMREIKVSTVKTEQYSRRDCITVTGVGKPEGETTKDLGVKVASTLSKSGVPVKVDDFSAFHRNGDKVKQIKQRDGRVKEIPPTITVKFKTVNKKDDVVKNYKNYDVENSKRNDIQVYHSLSPHYASLRRSILQYFSDGNNTYGKELKWVRYLSPSSGIAVKLKSDEFFKNINVIEDFQSKFRQIVVR